MLFFPSEAFGNAYLDIIVFNYACYKLQTSFFVSSVSIIIFLLLLEVDMHPFFVIFVYMHVCATHMYHSSSVIILVMCVHSRHVIVLSFASVSCDNCFGTCMVCLRE